MKSSGLKILLFEDDPLDIQININELEKEYKDPVIKTTAGENEFKSLVEEFQPDIILSDYNLPGYNGLDALHFISQNFPVLPIIIVTGSLDEETAASCIKEGAWDYVLKENIFRLNSAIKLALQHKEEKEKLKRSEEKLIESEALARKLINNIETGIILLSNDRTIEHINRKAELILESLSDKLTGKKLTEALELMSFSEEEKKNLILSEDIIKLNETLHDIVLRYHPAGSKTEKVLNFCVTPLFDENGKLDQVLLCFSDITEKLGIESELKDLKSRYEVTFNSVADGIFLYQPENFKLLDVNDKVLEMYDYSKEEILKLRIGDISDEKNGYTNSRARQFAEKALSGNDQEAEWRAKAKEGRCFWIHVILKALSIGDQKVLMGIVRDIDKEKETEYSLQKSQEHFRALTENSPDVIMRFDRDHRHIFVNSAVEDLINIPPEKFINKSHREMGVFPDEMCDFWEENIEIVFREKEHQTVEFSIDSENGKIEIEWRIFPEFDEDLEVESVLAVARDITENKLAEKKLRESEQRLQVVLDNIPQSIFWKDLESVYVGCNLAFARSAGIKNPAEIEGKTDFDLPWTEEQSKLIREVDQQVMKKNKPQFNLIESRRTAENEHTWINNNKVPLQGEKGEVVGILGTSENITEKKKAQEALRKNEERLQMALEGTSDGLWDWELGSDNIYFSPRYFTMLDFSPDEFKHDIYVLPELLHPDDKDWVLKEIESSVTERKEGIDMEYRMRRKDGSYAWILSRGKITYNEEGEPKRIVGMHADISLRKRHEKVQNVLIEIANSVNNTRNLNELFQQIQKSLGAIIDTRNCYVALYDEKNDTISLPFHQDEKDTFTEFPAGKTVTGYVIKTGQAQLVDLERVEKLEDAGEIEPIGAPSVSWLGVPLKIAEKIIGVFVVQSYTEEIQYTQDDVQLLEFVSDQIALAIERKIDQDKLKNNELRQRRIIESSPDGLVVIDMDGMVLDFNSTFLELLKLHEPDCEDLNFFDLIADKDVIRVQNILNETLNTSYSKNFEFKMKKKNNAEFYTETSFGLIHGIDDQEGNFVIVIKNIDERKIYEHNLRIAKEKAEESDRLKTAFLSNMSHEIRTPMNAIIGFSELLSRVAVTGQEKSEYISQINFAADTLIRLIDDIIDISKIEAGQLKMNPSIFNLKSLFAELNSMFRKTLEQQNKSHLEFVEENPNLSAGIQMHSDEFRLRQVFSNLINNAIKFTSSGRISYGIKSISGEKITFFVKDTGVGIGADKQKYIFDRFRQGHENKENFYGGTGLGLAISKNLIQLMGGELMVNSKENKGSEFYFSLPHKELNIEVPDEQVRIDRSPRDWSNRTFLIAEDDASNYFLLHENLKKYKVDIIWAKTGKEAIDLFEKNKDKLDLVLMDVQMPELNGYEATQYIKEIDPRIPVIAQTAYAMAGEREASLKAGCDDYISKPLIMNELIFILNKYLDREVVND